ncbi:uncharacterized protein SPAPADRAFT_131035 [Spathaspora passalidarum NRRL Y-27907]|uniref:Protein CMS1 n=1 Tax=Spathaspora passalidarum (strain NRRL Y-27907 / 11-Y1) TaxID=619300 RepID=G3AG35_SPAPN|nr:uncharacterized protein SPAPADRAFT_131035 [Spathaspora passalidarum NRRL Y-27907]EGW35174.1 hypothetical protein SPAPADRAFT_131035 [Spathaspora passalidarum NRRL Y-27907]
MAHPTADDLDDGLEYDLQLSDSEEETFVVEQPEVVKEEKEQPANKKRKQNTKFKETKKLKMEMDIETKKNMSVEESPEVIAEYINSKIRRKNPNLSALELADLYFAKSEIRSNVDFKETRNLDNLSAFITNRFKNMLPTKKGKEDSERKFIAIVSMSAIRACDIHRATRELSGSSLKLINKNKLNVDLKLVKSTRSRVLCCTPGRLAKVLAHEDSELQASEVKIIIVDNSYLDSKKQNIWDIPETFDVLKSLTKQGSKIYLY